MEGAIEEADELEVGVVVGGVPIGLSVVVVAARKRKRWQRERERRRSPFV